MNKEWVETKTREQEERFQSDISELIRKIKASKYLKVCQIEEIVNLLQEKNYLKASSRLERVTLERFDDATIDELMWSVKISTEIIEFFRKQRFEDYAEYADKEMVLIGAIDREKGAAFVTVENNIDYFFTVVELK